MQANANHGVLMFQTVDKFLHEGCEEFLAICGRIEGGGNIEKGRIWGIVRGCNEIHSNGKAEGEVLLPLVNLA